MSTQVEDDGLFGRAEGEYNTKPADLPEWSAQDLRVSPYMDHPAKAKKRGLEPYVYWGVIAFIAVATIGTRPAFRADGTIAVMPLLLGAVAFCCLSLTFTIVWDLRRHYAAAKKVRDDSEAESYSQATAHSAREDEVDRIPTNGSATMTHVHERERQVQQARSHLG